MVDAILQRSLRSPAGLVSKCAEDIIYRCLSFSPMARYTMRALLEHPFALGSRLSAEQLAMQASHRRVTWPPPALRPSLWPMRSFRWRRSHDRRMSAGSPSRRDLLAGKSRTDLGNGPAKSRASVPGGRAPILRRPFQGASAGLPRTTSLPQNAKKPKVGASTVLTKEAGLM